MNLLSNALSLIADRRLLGMCLLLVAATAWPGRVSADAVADDDIVLYVPFEGELADMGPNRLVIRGPYDRQVEVEFGPGIEGQAVRLSGENSGLGTRPTPALLPGMGSLTMTCWIKPDAALVGREATVMSSPMLYDLTLLKDGRLRAHFAVEWNQRVAVVSKDLGNAVFNGNWHQVAAVRDMKRNGEMRIYLDGQDVTAEPRYMPHAIENDAGAAGLMIGAWANWQLASFAGMIDEVRVYRSVPEAYRAATDAPPPPPMPVAPLDPLAGVSPQAAQSQAAVTLAPQTTRIVLPALGAFGQERDAAALLSKYLRRAYQTDTGFEVITYQQYEQLSPDERDRGFALAIGRTPMLQPDETQGLYYQGYILRRKGNALVIAGASPRATYWAAARFLDEFAGVRFYLPDDRFVSVGSAPLVIQGVDIVSEPSVRGVNMTGMHAPKSSFAWDRVNPAIRRLGGHQHNLGQVFPPGRYFESHPQIYPMRDGKRFNPLQDSGMWQICFSEPTAVDVALQSAREYFVQFPDAPYFAVGIDDTNTFCDCERCTQAMAAHAIEGDANSGLTYIHWKFVDDLARRLAPEFPEKRVAALAYSRVRKPPPFKLHPNVVAWQVWEMNKVLMDGIYRPNGDVEQWTRAVNHVAHHDWAHGRDFYIPMYYPGLVHLSYSKQEQLGAPIEFSHIEAYPNWGLTGPFLWMYQRILWDGPAKTDVQAMTNQFCKDMFGSAAPPMVRYWNGLEQLWIELNGIPGEMEPVVERKERRWQTQFNTTPAQREKIGSLRKDLDEAMAATEDPLVRERLAYFSESFKLSELLFGATAADAISPEQVQAIRDHARMLLERYPHALHPSNVDAAQTRLNEALTALDRAKAKAK